MANNYQIYPNREKRLVTEYIIITHANNLIIDEHLVTGNMIRGSYNFTWGDWQEYLIDWGHKKKLPIHYFVEFLDKDYVVFKGLQDSKPSYFISEQVENLIINRRYRNAILIVIGENYNVDIPEERMYQHLSDKVLIPLMQTYSLDWSRVMYYDECLNDSFLEDTDRNPSRFKYIPMKFFNMTKLRNELSKYNKNK